MSWLDPLVSINNIRMNWDPGHKIVKKAMHMKHETSCTEYICLLLKYLVMYVQIMNSPSRLYFSSKAFMMERFYLNCKTK